ncbi:sensor histidine kinase [Actinomyces bowdenii]|uniref:sensor histidine kinase n=1 Tax=Actinomyces bowdenii TaxID=131109 RepID=UPI001FBBF2DA|nr:histidine kinase [Actinomyces bowdenii]
MSKPMSARPRGGAAPGASGRWAERGGSAGRRGWLGIDWWASIWILFMAWPIVLVLSSPAPIWVKAVGVGSILGFSAIYVWQVSRIRDFTQLTPSTPLSQELAPLVRPLAAMTLCAGISLVAIHWWFAFYLPYYCAIILFTTRLRTGLILSAALISAILLIVLLGTDSRPVHHLAMGCAFSTGTVVLSRLGAGLENQRSRQNRAAAVAAEREEISREVHDILGHSLTLLTLKAEVAQRLISRDPQAAERELAEVIELSRAALADVRSTVTRLHAPDLASQVESSRTAFAAADIEAVFTGDVDRVPLGQRELISWALRETTTNILRHAGASCVEVEVAPGRLRVVDNGCGMDGAALGNGLRGLRQRIEAAGGELRLTSPAPRPPSGQARSSRGAEVEVIL